MVGLGYSRGQLHHCRCNSTNAVYVGLTEAFSALWHGTVCRGTRAKGDTARGRQR